MSKNKVLSILRVVTLLIAVICILTAVFKNDHGIYFATGLISLILTSIVNLMNTKFKREK